MTVLWWALAVAAGAFTAVRLAGAERGTPLVQLMAFTPFAAIGALLAGTAAALAGAGPPAWLLLGCGAVLAAVVAPRVVPGRRPPAGAGVRLRVMTANVLWERGDMAALLEQAKTDDVDVLALQEANAADLAAFERAGAEGLLPFRVVHAASRGKGSALFSRHPLADTPPPAVRRCPSGLHQAGATVLVPGAGPVRVESAHPCAPHPGSTACWARDLADQPVAGDGPPVVLLGDFNATLDHGPLRRLLRRGYRDAAAERGRGLVPTWPFALVPRPLRLLAVSLDHVLADRRIAIRDVAVRATPGSDHRAVVTELVLPPVPGAAHTR